MAKQPKNMDEALDIIIDMDADIDDALRLARKNAEERDALRDVARQMFNALNKHATEAEKEEARAAYFDTVNA